MLATILATAAVGCSSIRASEIAADYPSVDGSTSALPLQRTIACEIYDLECEWAPTFLPNTPQMITATDDTSDASFVNEIWHNGTHGSYVNLITGDADLILVAREPSDTELADAAQAGVQLDVRPVALDAFVFVTNVGAPASDLSLDTIRDIFTGDITHWDEAVPGATADPITTYKRNDNSGSQELMESLVMQGTPMVETSTELILESMMMPINMLSRDDRGIGYSVYFYAAHIFPAAEVQMISIDGVAPTPSTIADGSYSLSTEVYVAIRADEPGDSTATLLRDWLLTDDGQAAVAASGYVPLPDRLSLQQSPATNPVWPPAPAHRLQSRGRVDANCAPGRQHAAA